MWDLSCIDWADHMAAGRSIIPDLPLVSDEGDFALSIFDELRLPDVPGNPRMREACGDWFRDIVRIAFGSYDADTKRRMIRDIFLLAPKGSSKTSYSAGLMVTGMVINLRPRANMLFVGPTQSISDRAYDQAVGMIKLDPALKRLKPVEHLKAIVDLVTETEMKVKTFSLDILTGEIPILVMLDEIHLLGRSPHASKVIRQIRGGLEKTPEGLFIMTTTQSDDPPAGAFKDELMMARKIRDGAMRGQNIRPMLPVLYEFPREIEIDPVKWQDTHFWPWVMPNLGKSVHLDSLVQDWETERRKGEHAIRVWASQHLNIEIGVGLKTDAWPGAEFWELAVETGLTVENMLDRCEVIVVGVDGGGLDDLFGVVLLGRERETRQWLAVAKAWAHKSVLQRRQTIAARLQDFAEEGSLTIVDDDLDDIRQVVDLVRIVKESGLLACVAADPACLGELIEALAAIEVTQENGNLVGVGQGISLMNAIKTTERKLANGTLKHDGSALMAWCVGNLKIEPLATAIRATKQNAGDAKIDPVMALFDAVAEMIKNPVASGGPSGWETDDMDALLQRIEAAAFAAA